MQRRTSRYSQSRRDRGGGTRRRRDDLAVVDCRDPRHGRGGPDQLGSAVPGRPRPAGQGAASPACGRCPPGSRPAAGDQPRSAGGRPQDHGRAHPARPGARDTADKLGVLLPSTPSAQQIAWMKEITAADRLGLRPHRRPAAARGARDRPADRRRRAGGHPQRPGARHGDGDPAVRQPAHRLPGEHRAGRLLGAARHPVPGLLSGSVSWPDLIVPGLVLIACLLVAVALGATLRGRAGARGPPRRSHPRCPGPPPRGHRQGAARAARGADPTSPMSRRCRWTTCPPAASRGSRGTGGFPGRFRWVRSSEQRGSAPPAGPPRPAGSRRPGPPAGASPTPSSVSTAVSPGVTDTGPRHAVRR